MRVVFAVCRIEWASVFLSVEVNGMRVVALGWGKGMRVACPVLNARRVCS